MKSTKPNSMSQLVIQQCFPPRQLTELSFLGRKPRPFTLPAIKTDIRTASNVYLSSTHFLVGHGAFRPSSHPDERTDRCACKRLLCSGM